MNIYELLLSYKDFLLYVALAVYLWVYYNIFNIYDFSYNAASIYILCSNFSIEKVFAVAYSYLYFYFLILLVLLLITLVALNMCYTLTDNIVVTGTSIICSFWFMIIFYVLTTEPVDIFSLVIKASVFLIAEMMIIAVIVLSQNL